MEQPDAGAVRDRLAAALGPRYAVERELGRGGMATVYLARDRKHERPVAVKVLHPEVAATLGATRFRREIRIAAGLQHPHILPVYDSGSAGGLLWFTMPWVEGETLRARLRRTGPLPVLEAVRILEDVARALAYAHRRGVVHRDVKPENVLLGRDGAFLADFGVAKPLDAAAASDLTTAGLVVGTPAYVAPEQAAADPATDHRADLYAFGVLAYELLAGEPPFANLPLWALLAAHAAEEPVPIERRRPDLPPALGSLIGRCLRKTARARWDSADVMVELLQAVALTATGAVPPSAPAPAVPDADRLERARAAFAREAWREAHDVLVAADADGGLEAEDLERLAEAAWWLSQGTTCVRARERAHREYLRRGDLRAAAAMALELVEDHSHRLARSVAQGWLRRAERHLEELPESLQHGWLARLRFVHALSGDEGPEVALAHADRALGIARRAGDADLETLALQDRGRALVALGRVREGMALMDEAMTAVSAGQLTARTTGRAYCNMLSTCQRLGDIGRMAEWHEVAGAWVEPHGGSGFPGICRVHRAGILRTRGALPEAEREARRAAEELGDFLADVAGEAYYELGEIRLSMDDLAGAATMFGEAHARGREPQPGLALVRLAEGKPEPARVMIERALADPRLPALDRARLLPALAEIAVAVGDIARAEDAAAELESISRTYGTPALAASAALARGRVALARDAAADAVDRLRLACRSWTDLDLPLEIARARRLLAQAYRALGDDDAAELEERAARVALARVRGGAQAAPAQAAVQPEPLRRP